MRGSILNRQPAGLFRPDHCVDVVLDTDTYNEIDDAYALAYLLRSPEHVRLKAIYAAPFLLRGRSVSPMDGMEKSYLEAKKLLELYDMSYPDQRPAPPLYHGCGDFLPDERTAVDSEAVEDLIARASQYSAENPLYVIGIAALTDIASAILKAPEIVEKIVVIWLGGAAHHFHSAREFNLNEDVAAARVVFRSGVAMVHIPCFGVADTCLTTKPELCHWLQGKNPLCDYLVQSTVELAEGMGARGAWSRVLWDAAAAGWLMDGNHSAPVIFPDGTGDVYSDKLVPRPLPTFEGTYVFSPELPLYRYVYHIKRDLLVTDLFQKLSSPAIEENSEKWEV